MLLRVKAEQESPFQVAAVQQLQQEVERLKAEAEEAGNNKAYSDPIGRASGLS